MRDDPTFRITTYNAHSCRGLDRRTRPERIATVLDETGADIIALQEVWSGNGEESEREQVSRIAQALGLKYCFGGNWSRGDGVYGNAILSRSFIPRRVSDSSINTPLRKSLSLWRPRHSECMNHPDFLALTGCSESSLSFLLLFALRTRACRTNTRARTLLRSSL